MDKIEEFIKSNWVDFQSAFIERLMIKEGKIRPSGINSSIATFPEKLPFIEKPENEPPINYQETLLNASRSMIRFKRLEHLIKMINKLIDREVKVSYSAILLFREDKNSYVIIDSKGKKGFKIPSGFIKLTPESALINLFSEGRNFLISASGAIIYDDLINVLHEPTFLNKDPLLKITLEKVKHEMELLNISLCVPCYFKKRLLGLLMLGHKLSEKRFLREEMNLFATLANDVAMAITNAQLIRSLKERVKEVEESYNREHRLFFNTAIALAAAVDARDSYTHGHTERVTKFSMAILDEMGYMPEILDSKKFRESLHITALLHDIGKIGIPDKILKKKSILTSEEREVVSGHPVIGTTILYSIKELGPDILKAIRSHQEWYDGKGYPDSLKGKDIPLLARIISVADAFDAMTSDRPYREKMSVEDAISELKYGRGTQFDPEIVTAFLRANKKGKI